MHSHVIVFSGMNFNGVHVLSKKQTNKQKAWPFVSIWKWLSSTWTKKMIFWTTFLNKMPNMQCWRYLRHVFHNLLWQRMHSQATAVRYSHRVYNDIMKRWMLTSDNWQLILKQNEQSTQCSCLTSSPGPVMAMKMRWGKIMDKTVRSIRLY